MFRFTLNAWLPLCVLAGSDSGELPADEFNEVLILPDVHGDSDALLRSLWLGFAKIERMTPEYGEFEDMFADHILKGKFPYTPLSFRTDVAVVQLGDLVDRGPDSSYSISIMLAVERLLGWKTIILYGNHEILTMLGQANRYINPMDSLGFGSAMARSFSFQPGGYYFERIIADFSGFARLRSKTPNSNPSIDPNTLFVHGGVELDWILDKLAPQDTSDIDSLNEQFTLLAQDTQTRQEILNSETSIVWSRELALLPEPELCGERIQAILDHFKVARIIVGHTPQDDRRVKSRCEGRVILADVRMSKWMSSDEEPAPVALVLTVDSGTKELSSIVAHYCDIDGENHEVVAILDARGKENVAPVSKKKKKKSIWKI